MNRQQLIEDNMNLVYYLVHRYFPQNDTDEDIMQCGMIGLCKAANSWDETKSQFSTYASRAILHEIYREFKIRKRQIKGFSLDDGFNLVDSENPRSFSESVVGESDVFFVDFDGFYSQLKSREREVFQLSQAGLGTGDIAKKLGVSSQLVSYYLRMIRLKWRNVHGN